ncbi:hypothetical protein [Eubacterium ramulus]|jgi:hypothetical protein|uniref:Uncharacterized protein n=1 Tax=Eubacterium ramulus ATCC 29099 TaxID=1256908 RepID=U2P5R3_EUBRA|nr:hypothetical protein [Eubacterium ramulus]ERK45845.1 hypothetical protein HMPREF0373_01937 [Eubacterium ramulus ATCC 29099]
MEKFSKKFSRFTFDIPCGKMWKVLCKNTFFRKEKTSKPLSLLALSERAGALEVWETSV